MVRFSVSFLSRFFSVIFHLLISDQIWSWSSPYCILLLALISPSLNSKQVLQPPTRDVIAITIIDCFRHQNQPEPNPDPDFHLSCSSSKSKSIANLPLVKKWQMAPFTQREEINSADKFVSQKRHVAVSGRWVGGVSVSCNQSRSHPPPRPPPQPPPPPPPPSPPSEL